MLIAGRCGISWLRVPVLRPLLERAMTQEKCCLLKTTASTGCSTGRQALVHPSNVSSVVQKPVGPRDLVGFVKSRVLSSWTRTADTAHTLLGVKLTRSAGNDLATYPIPMEKIRLIMILLTRGICNRHTTGKGSATTMTSMAKLTAPGYR